jgi:hypothetical protein
MAGIKSCIDKIKGFPESLKSRLLSLSERYKGQGKNELEADTAAILEVHKDLHEELNDLKRSAKTPVKKYVKPDTSKAVKDVQERHKQEDEADAKKAEAEKVQAKTKADKSAMKKVYSKMYSEYPKTFEEAVLRYFLSGRRISTADFKRYTGFGAKNERTGKTKGKAEFNQYIWAHRNKDVPSIDNLVHQIWVEDMNMPEENFDEQDRINEFFDVLMAHTGKRDIFNSIVDIQKGYIEDYASPEEIRQAKEYEEAEKFLNERELSEEEIKEELEKEAYREQAFAETGRFQKSSQIENKDIKSVVDRVQKALPKFNIVYNPKLKAAGKINGTTIELNPQYAGKDTPIHEAGHALIDFIGYNNKVIQTGIKQLKDTELWKETAAKYPELSDERLGKEVLAEAIGREGAGIFDTEAKKSRFKQVLDYIYTKLKQLLGLDKNVAKSLAKQIIGGIATKEAEAVKEDALQKKKKPEEGDEKSELTDKEKKVEALYNAIKDIEDLAAVPYEDLVQAYNYLLTSENIKQKDKKANELLKRIGMNFFQRASEKVKKDPKYSVAAAKFSDISKLDKTFKALSHFTAEFPELKELSIMWDSAFIDKVTEAKENKHVNYKLGEQVIKERNSKLGIAARLKNILDGLFGNINYKYFDYLDNGKGGLITVQEAKKKNLSDAQIKYLEYVRETIAEREGYFEQGEDAYNIDMDVLKMDKRFYENFKTGNVVSTASSLLGNTYNINNVRIPFTNPNTGKEQVTEYQNIENILTNYAKKGLKEKAKALTLIAKYNIRARAQLKKGVNADQVGDEKNVLKVYQAGDYSLSQDGYLKSKFDKNRDPGRAYSKDFYTAMQEYIDDTQHIKHIQPLVPIINAIDYINKKGVYEFEGKEKKQTLHGEKKNLTAWLEDWSNYHVLKRPKEGIKEVDAALRFFRNLTSAVTMMFNVPAQAMNVAIGNYNNWRQENFKTWVKGQKRLFVDKFTERKLTKDYAFGTLNPYAIDIARKYGAVSTDIDSNPIQTAGGTLAALGYLGTKWGEFQIQASGLMGLLSDEDYNSFEYKKNKFGVDELVVKKGVDEKALKERILKSINRVSDVQGKYSEKDRRNFMNNELGKSIAQYKTWIPDWFRMRYGEEGSWTKMLRGGFAELRKDISEKGTIKAFWENDNFMRNFKGLVTTVFLASLAYSDDDDDETSKAAKVAKKALSDVLFIYDPNNSKFLLDRPIASVGTVIKFIDAADHLMMNEADDFYKGKSKYGDVGDPKVVGDFMSMIPGRRTAEAAVDVLEDEGEK